MNFVFTVRKSLAFTSCLQRKLLIFSSRSMASSTQDAQLLRGLDSTQIDLLKEECILVDDSDTAVGAASKKHCHLWENIEKGLLHRAFSVFLFNSENKLLIQQRADSKITFPGHFTNTCCSHPLDVDSEKTETDALGVKRAARRKLNHELGIKSEKVPLDDFHFLRRMRYKARNVPDKRWGEHEIDYILFIQADVTVEQNDNEVKTHRYVDQSELRTLLEDAKRLITPWFSMICEGSLFTWWNDLARIKATRGACYNRQDDDQFKPLTFTNDQQ